MPIEEIAYLAGIFDGEGYVGISHNGIKAKYKQYTLKLAITNTNLDLINWLMHRFDFYLLKRKKYVNTFNRKQVYQCLIQGNKVIDMLNLIYPYLIIKKNKAALILKEWPEKGSRSNEKRTEIYNRIKQLTKEPYDAVVDQ